MGSTGFGLQRLPSILTPDFDLQGMLIRRRAIRLVLDLQRLPTVAAWFTFHVLHCAYAFRKLFCHPSTNSSKRVCAHNVCCAEYASAQQIGRVR